MQETSIESSIEIYDNYFVYDYNNQCVIINKSICMYGDHYNYDKVLYVNRNEKIIMTCPLHGDFKITPKLHYRGVGCKKCNHH